MADITSIDVLFQELDRLGLTAQLFADLGVGDGVQIYQLQMRTSVYFNWLDLLHNNLTDALPEQLGADAAFFRPALEDPRLLGQFCLILDEFSFAAVNVGLAGHGGTYNEYFIQNIINANYAENLDRFFTASPATLRVLHALLEGFFGNISTAVERIRDNKADIEKVFIGAGEGDLEQLERIRSSGSDFHKGGKQVLFLTFTVHPTLPFGDVELSLVYKPSDLEVDCLLIGDTAAVNSVHADFQERSLIELFNLWVGGAQGDLQLPTYKILPYQFGSGLVAQNGRLPIRNSYGYLQFLGTENQFNFVANPQPGVGNNVLSQADQEKVRAFYLKAGAFVALASSFSLLDLHADNLIVSGFLPHFIDLEIGLTLPVDRIDATGLFGPQGAITGGAGQVEGRQRTFDEALKEIGENLQTSFRNNRLFAGQPPGVIEVDVDALILGFNAAMNVLGANAQDARLVDWANRLDNTVVRYLPLSTAEFDMGLRTIYKTDQVKNEDFFEQAAQQAFYNTEGCKYQDGQVPNFLALHPDYIAEDFGQGDVPVFYRRIDSLDVMDSRGDTVTVRNAVFDCGGQPKMVDIGRGTFFDDEPMSALVQTQVLALQDRAIRQQRITQLLEQLLAQLGVQNAANQQLPVNG